MFLSSDGSFILISWVLVMLTIVIKQNYKTGALFEAAKVTLSPDADSDKGRFFWLTTVIKHNKGTGTEQASLVQ